MLGQLEEVNFELVLERELVEVFELEALVEQGVNFELVFARELVARALVEQQVFLLGENQRLCPINYGPP